MAIRSDYKAVDKAEFLREWLWLMDMSFRELCDLQKHYEGRGGVRYRATMGNLLVKGMTMYRASTISRAK